MALAMIVSITGCSGEQSSSVVDESVQTVEATQESMTSATTTTSAAKPEEDVPEVSGPKYQTYATMTAEEITASLTLEQKAAQMVQPVIYMLSDRQMAENCYGSILG